MPPTALNGPEILSRSSVTKNLIIFLHGLGADGNDLLSIGPMLGLEDTTFVSPNAPFPCDMAPYGYQWFSLQDRNPDKVLAGIKIAAPILNAYIDTQIARFKLSAKNVALIGFSQGSMMSLYTAPRRAEAIAGVIGISGALFGPELLASEVKSRPPICLIHGQMDEVVPFGAMGLAEKTLKETKFSVEAHARPMLAHGIDEEGIDITSAFLKRVFGA